MKDRRESKRRTVIYPDYQTRIREYNREKQTALLGCEAPEQVEKVIAYLRKKWAV